MNILPEGTETRWQQAIRRDSYLEWLSYRFYLNALARLARSENSHFIAGELQLLADVAHQRALDLEPVRIEEDMGEAA